MTDNVEIAPAPVDELVEMLRAAFPVDALQDPEVIERYARVGTPEGVHPVHFRRLLTWANARLDKMAKWQHEIDMVALAGRDAQIARRNFFIRHAIAQLETAATNAGNSGQRARLNDTGPMAAIIGTLRNALTDGPLVWPYDGKRLVQGDDGALRVERVKRAIQEPAP